MPLVFRTGRWIALAALLLGAVRALPRLAVYWAPQASYPDLTVSYSAGPSTGPSDIARDGLEPLAQEILRLGGVAGTAGEVHAGGAEVRVRFAPGVDLEAKAARLERALTDRRSARGSAFGVRAGSGPEGDRVAVLWLGPLDDVRTEALAEILRAVPGVRSVDRRGGTREQVRYRLPQPPGPEADGVRLRVERFLEAESLGFVAGETAERERLSLAPAARALEALPVPSAPGSEATATAMGVPLATMAEREVARVPVPAQIHLDGESGRALWIWREHEAPPLAVSSSLHRCLRTLPGGFGAVSVRWLEDEAEPIRRLLLRLLAGLTGASLAAGAFGWRRGGAARAAREALKLPLGLAGALLALHFTGSTLDATTLPAVLLAAGAAAVGAGAGVHRGPAGALRTRLAPFLAAASIPLAAWLGAPILPPLLTAPCRAFGLAALAGLAVLALLPGEAPEGAEARGAPSVPAGSWLRGRLRDPVTALLAVGALAFVSIVYFAEALTPRAGSPPGSDSDLTLSFRTPAGATLAEAATQLAPLERALAREPRILRYWTDLDASQARIELRLAPEAAAGAERERLIAALRLALPGASSLRFEGTGTGGAVLGQEELEQRAESDVEAERYTVLVQAARWQALRDGVAALRTQLRQRAVLRRAFTIEDVPPSVFVDLAPLAGEGVARAGTVAPLLAQASSPPAALPLPGGNQRTLAVLPAGVSTDPDRVPQRADLLGRALRLAAPAHLPDGAALAGDWVVPAALFRIHERLEPSRLAWQSGRFSQAVTVNLQGLATKEVRIKERAALDRALAGAPLPLGCQLERPGLGWLDLHRISLRRGAFLVILPILWLFLAAIRLDSVPAALASLAPVATGAAAAAPVVWAAGGKGDEATLFALAASLAAALPLGLAAVGAIADRRGRPGARSGAYRELRAFGPIALAEGALFATLTLLPTLGADPVREPWIVPLRAAAAGGGVAGAAALLPALLLVPSLRRRNRPVAVAPSHPSVAGAAPVGKKESAPPSLAVHNLSKVYRGGHRALRRVSFELGPGVVGLLGPNGAGKTTLIRCLVGLLEPTRGQVLVDGRAPAPRDRATYRRRTGFLPQDFNAYPGFSAERFLDYWATARELPGGAVRREEIERLLATVSLAEHAKRKVRDFSGGMRRRLGIAAALLGSPPFLIVDEPTTGLDIESRARFRETLLAVAAERVVLLSTHIASDVEAIAGRLLVLHRGSLIFDGPPADLIAQARGTVFETLVQDSELRDISHRYQLTSRVRLLAGIRVRGVGRAGEPLPGAAVEPTLEEAYLAGQKAASGAQ